LAASAVVFFEKGIESSGHPGASNAFFISSNQLTTEKKYILIIHLNFFTHEKSVRKLENVLRGITSGGRFDARVEQRAGAERPGYSKQQLPGRKRRWYMGT
jgi:hypothetical protein